MKEGICAADNVDTSYILTVQAETKQTSVLMCSTVSLGARNEQLSMVTMCAWLPVQHLELIPMGYMLYTRKVMVPFFAMFVGVHIRCEWATLT